MSKKGNNQHERKSIHTHSLHEIADYARDARVKRRGAMVLFIKPDGTVRAMREDLLEDDSGKGVVCSLCITDTTGSILEKLIAFTEREQAYLRMPV